MTVTTKNLVKFRNFVLSLSRIKIIKRVVEKFYFAWVSIFNASFISIKAKIDRTVDFIHPLCIFIQKNAEIKENVTIGQMSVIGTSYKVVEKDGRIIWINKEAKNIIEENVKIGANVLIIGNVTIRKNTIIGAGSIIVDSKIGKNCRIGPGCIVYKSVVGDNCKIEAGVILSNKKIESNRRIKLKENFIVE